MHSGLPTQTLLFTVHAFTHSRPTHLLSLITVPLPIVHKPRRATSTPRPPPHSAPAFTLTCRHDAAFFPPLCKPGRTKDSTSSHLWDCHPAGKGEGCEAACDSRWWCERRATGRGWVRGWVEAQGVVPDPAGCAGMARNPTRSVREWCGTRAGVGSHTMRRQRNVQGYHCSLITIRLIYLILIKLFFLFG